MTLFDIDAERVNELTAAFAAGEARGRERSDEDLVDLMVELRVSQARECAAHTREGIEVGFCIAILVLAVVVCVTFFAAWLL